MNTHPHTRTKKRQGKVEEEEKEKQGVLRNQRPPGGGRPSLYRSMIDLRTRHPSSDCVVDPGPGCRGRALRATRNTREDITTVATTPCQLPVLRSRPWSFLVIPAFPAVVPPATRSRTLIVKRLGRLREATRPRSIAASPPVHLFSEGQKIRPGTGVLRAGGRDATRPSQNCVLTFAKPPTHGPGTWDEKGRGRKSTTLPMTPSRLAPGRELLQDLAQGCLLPFHGPQGQQLAVRETVCRSSSDSQYAMSGVSCAVSRAHDNVITNGVARPAAEISGQDRGALVTAGSRPRQPLLRKI